MHWFATSSSVTWRSSGSYVAAGADFISLAGNEANGRAVGPEYFRRHVLPYEIRLVEALHGLGGPRHLSQLRPCGCAAARAA